MMMMMMMMIPCGNKQQIYLRIRLLLSSNFYVDVFLILDHACKTIPFEIKTPVESFNELGVSL